jgi:hypothetical protein
MARATTFTKETVCEILTQSFFDNKSVNYIVKQDHKVSHRIKELMKYSYNICGEFGKIYINKNETACALVLYPEKKKAKLKTILWDIRFVLKSLGLNNLFKVLKRESAIRKIQPKGNLFYLWFIGVDPQHQHQGLGTKLLEEMKADAKKENRIMCLETSTLKNIPWYQQSGFNIYAELDFGYKLYCLKNS